MQTRDKCLSAAKNGRLDIQAISRNIVETESAMRDLGQTLADDALSEQLFFAHQDWKTCYICNLPGHISARCPNRSAMGLDGTYTPSVNSTSGPQKSYALQHHTSTEQVSQRNFNRGGDRRRFGESRGGRSYITRGGRSGRGRYGWRNQNLRYRSSSSAEGGRGPTRRNSYGNRSAGGQSSSGGSHYGYQSRNNKTDGPGGASDNARDPIQRAHVLRFDVNDDIFHNDAESLNEHASMLYIIDCPPDPGEINIVDADEVMTPCEVQHTSDVETSVLMSVPVSHDHVELTVDSAHDEQDVFTAHTEQDISSAHIEQDSVSACNKQDFIPSRTELDAPSAHNEQDSSPIVIGRPRDIPDTESFSYPIAQSRSLSKIAVDDLLSKYPYLSESLREWSDDPNENWDRLVMEVEKSQQMAEDIVSTMDGVRNLKVDGPDNEENRSVRARSEYFEGSRNHGPLDESDNAETAFFSRVEISLTVQLPQRKYLTLKMSYADKIIDIKLKIMREMGIPCADFYLTVADRSLDDDKTLVESRLLPGSNLYLRLRLRGGVRGGTHDDIPNPEMYEEDDDLILGEINLERLNQQFQPIADNINMIAEYNRNNSVEKTCLLSALYTLKDHVNMIVKESLLWGRYLAEALASVSYDVDHLEGMDARLLIRTDEVLRLTLIINSMECMPHIEVIKRPERIILREIRPRTQDSIELDDAVRLIRERGETIIHHATMMHIGSLNEMYTSLAELRGELTVLGVRCLELISGTDHDRDVLFSRVEISLTVQLPQRKYLTFKMSYADRIIDIKLKIMREVGIPCANFYLTVADRSLYDDKTLVESRLLPGRHKPILTSRTERWC